LRYAARESDVRRAETQAPPGATKPLIKPEQMGAADDVDESEPTAHDALAMTEKQVAAADAS
jgi:hypothetical protein